VSTSRLESAMFELRALFKRDLILQVQKIDADNQWPNDILGGGEGHLGAKHNCNIFCK